MSGPDPRPEHQSTVAITVVTPFIRLALERGPEFEHHNRERLMELLARWGLTVAQLEHDRDLRLPFELVLQLSDLFMGVLDGPVSAVEAATRLQPGDYGLIEYLVASCSTLGEAIECQGRYYPLLIDASYELSVVGDTAEVRFSFFPGLPGTTAFYEYALASNWVMAMHHVAWEGAQPPVESRYGHPRPPHAERIAEVMASPVHFDCPDYATVFPVSMLDQPMRDADPELHRLLRRQADQELDALTDRNALPELVRRAMRELLPATPNLENVAGQLSMSSATLRARLRRYGSTFSEVLDSLRREEATRLLSTTRLGVAEVAHALGFQHAPALHRACMRWFGKSPSEYRSRQPRHPMARYLGGD